MFTDMKEGTASEWAHIAAEHGKHQLSAAPRQIMESLARLDAIEVGFAATQLDPLPDGGDAGAALGRKRRGGGGGALPRSRQALLDPQSRPDRGRDAEALRVATTSITPSTGTRNSRAAIISSISARTRKGASASDDESWYAFAEKLVDEWDAPAFDPDFDVDSLESFEPEVTRVFSRPRAMV